MSSLSVSLPLTFRVLGSPDEKKPLELLDRTISTLGEDELLVKVTYSSINAMDPKLQQHNRFGLPKPIVTGFDFSGTVVGEGGKGDAKVADGSIDPSITVGSEIFGWSFSGGCFGQYIVAKRGAVALRGEIPAKEATTYGIAYLSAWEPLFVEAKINQHKGKTIFLPGAGGGVGHFATQLAKLHGLRVIGSAGNQKSLDLLKANGVDVILNYKEVDVIKEVMKHTNGQGADIVYDSTYRADSMLQSASVVAKGGAWYRLGGLDDSSKDAVTMAESRGAVASYGDFGRYMRTPEFIKQIPKMRATLGDAVKLFNEGVVRPHVSQVIPFDPVELQKALTDNITGKSNTGKVVLKVS